MKDFKIPDENDPNFWIKPWIPQVEVLAHPAIKAGLTHCGFGGTLEFIAAGKPIVAFPHFIDQPPNAIELEKRKVAKILYSKGVVMETDIEEMCVYREEVFDEQKVYDTFKEVVEDESYTTNMLKQ